MNTIMQNIQQLLPLLTVSIASKSDVADAVSDLQSRIDNLQGSSAEASVHLRHIRRTVEALSSGDASGAHVQQCMADMQSSMFQLNEASVEKVVEGCVALHHNLSQSLESVSRSVDMLQLTVDTFSSQMLSLQKEMRDDIGQIKRCLGKLCDLPGGTTESLQPGRILAVRSCPEIAPKQLHYHCV